MAHFMPRQAHAQMDNTRKANAGAAILCFVVSHKAGSQPSKAHWSFTGCSQFQLTPEWLPANAENLADRGWIQPLGLCVRLDRLRNWPPTNQDMYFQNIFEPHSVVPLKCMSDTP